MVTKALSEQSHDLVAHVVAWGRTPVARALVKGSDLRADVSVFVARTSDVAQKWLDSVPEPNRPGRPRTHDTVPTKTDSVHARRAA